MSFLFYFFLYFICSSFFFFFFFNDTATTEIYTLSLHDALPISLAGLRRSQLEIELLRGNHCRVEARHRSEEHTSELQSRRDLVCRLLLEKKKKKKKKNTNESKTKRRTSIYCENNKVILN